MLAAVTSLSAMCAAFGVILGIAGKKFAVEVDPRVDAILQVVPGANCGACGQPGCGGYAEAVVNGSVHARACAPGGASLYEKIAAILGTEVSDYEERTVAQVLCQGGTGQSKMLYRYKGVEDCHAALAAFKGPKACNYGCVRLGSCAKVCPFGAIEFGADGLPVVDYYKCTGCNKCVEECPQNLIKLVGVTRQVHVRCVNIDKGKDAKRVCSVACIKCKLCEKNCPAGAVHVVASGSGTVAVIDYDKCTNCGLCVDKCSTNAIAMISPISEEALLDSKEHVNPGCKRCEACQ